MKHAGTLAMISLLVGLAGQSPVVAAEALSVGPSRASESSTVDPALVLDADGRFLGAAGLVGTIDDDGWTLASDLSSGQAPVLEPSASSSITAATLGATVYALAVDGSNLYVGGEFRNVAGIPEADYVARWDGTAWSALGSNGAGNGALDLGVRAIAIHGSNVVVGGYFSNVAGIAGADFVARWTGSSWAPLQNLCCGAAAINNAVYALAAHGDFVYAGGYFTDAGGYTGVNYLARWSVPCDCWSSVGPAGSMTGPIFEIEPGVDKIYVGGLFENAGGNPSADNVAFWDGDEWWHLAGASVNGPVFSMIVLRNEELSDDEAYVGGGFTNAGSAAADYLAYWDGLIWYPLGSNGNGDGALNDSVYAMSLVNGSLFVGGTFEDAGGNLNADSGARWNGSDWYPLAASFSALNSHVFALAPGSNGIYIGGHFTDAGRQPDADRIVLRRGSEWIPLSPRRPDGRIRLGGGSLVGNNIYNGTGVNQTRTGSTTPGHVITFGISGQNDSNVAERIRFAASGTVVTGYTIRYFNGSTDITSAVNAGTYQSPLLAPGSAFLITAKVTVKSAAATGSSVSRLVTVRSVGDPTRIDVVKFVGKRS